MKYSDADDVEQSSGDGDLAGGRYEPVDGYYLPTRGRMTRLRRGAMASKRTLITLALATLPFLVLIALWRQLKPTEVQDQIAVIQLVATVVGGLILLLGLYFTSRRDEVAREGQLTDRFSKAIEQLGQTESLEVRLGGIYALERIARDSERDHWPIMEVLTAYVREHARWDAERPVHGELASDIQAVLTVIGRRSRTYGRGESRRLNLSGVDLRRADLRGAHLEGANLWNTHLEEASLDYAHLEASHPAEAHFEAASLWGAHLQGAVMAHTHLEGASLHGVDFKGATFVGVHFEGAILNGTHFEGVNLSTCLGLTRRRLQTARTDSKTILPDDLPRGDESVFLG